MGEETLVSVAWFGDIITENKRSKERRRDSLFLKKFAMWMLPF